jgi:hypothetical protein
MPNTTPQAIAAHQQQCMRHPMAYAHGNVPSYRALYRNHPSDCTDLQALPPVTKRTRMAAFDRSAGDGP